MLTTEEAAQVLNVRPRTVQRWCREGRLPSQRFGKDYRIWPADLQRVARGGTDVTKLVTPAPRVGSAQVNHTARRGRTLAIGNQKGGVGKTTTTQALGAALAELGARVLLVDLDPQGSLTSSVGIDTGSVTPTVYDLMEEFFEFGEVRSFEAAVRPIAENLDLLASNIGMSVADLALAQRDRREYVLSEVLAPIRDQYDWILIDCPPALSLLTINALTCADECLMPVTPEPMVTATLDLFLDTVVRVRKNKLNPRLRIVGIVLTRVESRSVIERGVIDDINEAVGHGIPILGEIRANAWVHHASAQQVLITRLKQASEVANAYRQIAEVLNHGN